MGLGGSIHCMAMCGGLVTACTSNQLEIIRYQFGRLISYSTIALISGFLASLINTQLRHPLVAIIPSLMIGALFIYWGIGQITGFQKELPMPIVLKKIYQLLWSKFIHNSKNSWRGFFVGLLSIFLPCGLLYGVTMGLATAEHPTKAWLAMFCFWLGTLPSMILFPKLFQNLIAPIKSKMPKTLGVLVLSFGLITVGFRLYQFEEKSRSYEIEIKKGERYLSPSKNICH